MSGWQIGLAAGLLIGLVAARWTVRASITQQPIQAGGIAPVLHYLACAAQTAAAPSALIGVLLSHDLHFFPRLLTGVALAFGCIGLALLLLIGLAAIEIRTRPGQAG